MLLHFSSLLIVASGLLSTTFALPLPSKQPPPFQSDSRFDHSWQMNVLNGSHSIQGSTSQGHGTVLHPQYGDGSNTHAGITSGYPGVSPYALPQYGHGFPTEDFLPAASHPLYGHPGVPPPQYGTHPGFPTADFLPAASHPLYGYPGIPPPQYGHTHPGFPIESSPTQGLGMMQPPPPPPPMPVRTGDGATTYMLQAMLPGPPSTSGTSPSYPPQVIHRPDATSLRPCEGCSCKRLNFT
jgi:hypothetical protein